MTIDEAIKKLAGLAMGDSQVQMENYVPALKLGIEALKRERANREQGLISLEELLPGETK